MVAIPSVPQQQTRSYSDSLSADMALPERAIPGCLVVDLSAIQYIGIFDINARTFLNTHIRVTIIIFYYYHINNININEC